MGYCSTLLTAYPISSFMAGAPNDIGLISVVAGFVNILMSFLTIFWIKRQERKAQYEHSKEGEARSVIFPVFVKVLWLSVIVNVYFGVLYMTVPLEFGTQAEQLFPACFYASLWALQHTVIEGIAVLLMQKGCGTHAEIRAVRLTFCWTFSTFFAMIWVFYYNTSISSIILQILWDFVLVIFYGLLWHAPSENLFRRPAAIEYAKFWCLYRLGAVIVNVLNIFTPTEDLSYCGYILMRLLILSISQPWVCYWTLLQDSQWWQGDDVQHISSLFWTLLSPLFYPLGYRWAWGRYSLNEEIDRLNSRLALGTQLNKPSNLKTLNLGVDFSLSSAQSLAQTMDDMRVQGQVKMLNFASIKIDFHQLLGSGSFSKVYTGYYRGEECAIKLIRTIDLTTDVIRRVAAEASILSSIRHPNIVNIIGVSVLPPSVCLILEKCSFGSLSDVIRGYGFDWSVISRPPLILSLLDVLWLALGCAKGLAAVHSYGKFICHRDVKSFNFLVDKNFNVKIADLELGSFVNKVKSNTTSSTSSFSCASLCGLLKKSPVDTQDATPVSNRYDEEIVLVQNPMEEEGSASISASMSMDESENKSLVRLTTIGSTVDDSDFDSFLNNPQDLLEKKPETPSKGKVKASREPTTSLYNTYNSTYNSQTNRYNTTKSNFNEPFQEGVDVEGLIVNWLAPEVIKTGNFVQASDIYSLGTVFWEILSRKAPYENIDQMAIREMVTTGYNLPIPTELENSQFAKIIKLCWSFNPKDRPTAEEVVTRLEALVQDYPFLHGGSHLSSDSQKEIPQTRPLLDYYEKLYKKTEEPKSWMSPLFSNHLFSMGHSTSSMPYMGRNSSISSTSCVSVDLSIPDDNTVGYPKNSPSFISKFKTLFHKDSMSGSLTSAAALAAATAPPTASPMPRSDSASLADIESASNERLVSGDSYRSSYSVLPNPTKVSSSHVLPPDIAAPILAIQKQPYWSSLEKNQEAWMVVTVEAPHIILHATSHFYALMEIPQQFRPACGQVTLGNSLMSLQNLIFNEFGNLDYSACSYSNTYVETASSCENSHMSSFKNICSASAARIKDALFSCEQFHDVINFHLPSVKKRYGLDDDFQSDTTSVPDTVTEPSELGAYSSQIHSQAQPGSRQTSTASSLRSLIEPKERIGSNKMCTIHGFPVYPFSSKGQDPEGGEADVQDCPPSSTPASSSVSHVSPVVSQSPSASSSFASHGHASSSFFSAFTKSFVPKKVDSPRPIYYLIMMKELRSSSSARKMIVREKYNTSNSFRDSLSRLSDSISRTSITSNSSALYNYFSRPSSAKSEDPTLIQLQAMNSSNV